MGAGPLARPILFVAPAVLAVALALPGCAGSDVFSTRTGVNEANWRSVATENDRKRLRDWRDAFVEGLDAANRNNAGDVASLGALLNPDLTNDNPLPPVGDYRCRVIKLGTTQPGSTLTYIAYSWFHCSIADRGNGTWRFTKHDGSQRPIGNFYEHERHRGVFLGTLQLSDETHKIPYGRDRDRDMAGFVERVGDSRWRIILPRPHFESVMDVMELVSQ